MSKLVNSNRYQLIARAISYFCSKGLLNSIHIGNDMKLSVSVLKHHIGTALISCKCSV